MNELTKEQKPLLITIFDLLLPAGSCGPSGCGPNGCGPTVRSENLMELETLAVGLVKKYGNEKLKFDLINILDASMQNHEEAYRILRDRKGDALPMIAVNNEVKFIGEVPSVEEFEKVLEELIRHD